METPKQRLEKLYHEYYGIEPCGDESELQLIVTILEQLVEDIDEQKGHSHSIE